MLKVYSTNCPKCKILEKKLTSLGKEFELIDDSTEVMEASEKYDIKVNNIFIEVKCHEIFDKHTVIIKTKYYEKLKRKILHKIDSDKILSMDDIIRVLPSGKCDFIK